MFIIPMCSAEAGLEVQARDSKKSEYVNDPVYSGSAGGFGGALLNGSVKDSKVTNLRKVNGMNYTGGFIGHLGKSGTVDLDNLGALGDLLSAAGFSGQNGDYETEHQPVSQPKR